MGSDGLGGLGGEGEGAMGYVGESKELDAMFHAKKACIRTEERYMLLESFGAVVIFKVRIWR